MYFESVIDSYNYCFLHFKDIDPYHLLTASNMPVYPSVFNSIDKDPGEKLPSFDERSTMIN